MAARRPGGGGARAAFMPAKAAPFFALRRRRRAAPRSRCEGSRPVRPRRRRRLSHCGVAALLGRRRDAPSASICHNQNAPAERVHRRGRAELNSSTIGRVVVGQLLRERTARADAHAGSRRRRSGRARAAAAAAAARARAAGRAAASRSAARPGAGARALSRSASEACATTSWEREARWGLSFLARRRARARDAARRARAPADDGVVAAVREQHRERRA